LIEPRRRVVLAAKLAAAMSFAFVYLVVCFGGGLILLNARDVGVVLTGPHSLDLIVGTTAGSALGAMLGVATGTLIRNQVGAIVAVAAYAFAVDAVLQASPNVTVQRLNHIEDDVGRSGRVSEHPKT
jgi:ABC-2 type transport system permease protein